MSLFEKKVVHLSGNLHLEPQTTRHMAQNCMETLNISEKKKKIKWNYDAEADILYISFGNPGNAEGVDIGEGTIIRIQPETKEIIGVTILNPLNRTLSSLMGKHKISRKKKTSHIIK